MTTKDVSLLAFSRVSVPLERDLSTLVIRNRACRAFRKMSHTAMQILYIIVSTDAKAKTISKCSFLLEFLNYFFNF